MAQIKDKCLYSWKAAKVAANSVPNQSLVDTLLDGIRRELSAYGDRIIIREAYSNKAYDRQEISLSELEPAMTKLANALHSSCLQLGDVMQCYMYNNVDFFVPVVATWMVGAVPSMGDPSISQEAMVEQLRVIRPKVIFCSQLVTNKVQAACKSADLLPIVVIVDPDSKLANNSNITIAAFSQNSSPTDIPVGHKKRKLEDDAVIFWSSGTTGNPKGVVVSHKTVISNLKGENYNVHGRITCSVQTTCMFHAGGFTLCLVNAVKNGNTIITFSLQEDVKADQIFTVIDKYKPKSLMLASHHGVMLSTNDPEPGLDLASVTKIVPVGAKLSSRFPKDIRKRFPNVCNVVNAYGMTEVFRISMASNDFSNLGSLVSGVSVKIVDPHTGEKLSPNQTGEICVKTSTMMKCYINVTAETTQTTFTEDGYFKTGDLGRYDQNGVLYYIDRLKALIKYKGYHIYPAEVESALRKHPDVLDVGVFGIPEPSVMELISAAVIKRKGCSLTARELEEFANSQLDEHQKIRGGIYFMNSLPKNLQGKILRKKLRALVEKPQ